MTTSTDYARTINGVQHQEQIAWRAYRNRLVVVRSVRPLVMQPDGRLRPSRSWRVHEERTHRPVGPVKRTRGVVKAGLPAADDDDTGTGTGTATIPAAHRTGAETASYLPEAVRVGAALAIPDPAIWTGRITQWDNGRGLVSRQEIANLRLSAERALVIRATRGDGRESYTPVQIAAHPWEVTQLAYDLPHVPGIPRTRGVDPLAGL
ncbi:hypothetical protein [Georgenia yuyongxinii]|uniref:Uncharacterized protein n=1 Tax=Georgenia yuyongxinii TaxID=2589797 RepID=A0A552WUH2_9MICO|nr:hypothetical protein [Georgenia yuyongxinii]TRW46424.1 hypothetical protein FJ693_05715 [Georgenia yuyongxinii]